MGNLAIIGRAERIFFTSHPKLHIPAKIDTGADTSAVWASDIHETAEGLSFCLFDRGSEYYTGAIIHVAKPKYRRTRIANSFGVNEKRYVATLEVQILDRSFEAEFTLANRSTKTYPMLLGRSLLADRFLVDVTKGDPLIELERARAQQLKEFIDDNK